MSANNRPNLMLQLLATERQEVLKTSEMSLHSPVIAPAFPTQLYLPEGAWLGVLRLLAMRLPQRAVITNGGDLQRAPGQDRIAFLAAVRNAALAPLWQVIRKPHCKWLTTVSEIRSAHWLSILQGPKYQSGALPQTTSTADHIPLCAMTYRLHICRRPSPGLRTAWCL